MGTSLELLYKPALFVNIISSTSTPTLQTSSTTMQLSQMIAIFAILALVAAVVNAYPGYLGGAYGHQSIEEYSYPRYKFDYAVYDPHSGDIKNQWESRDGDVVKGSYSLKEADGSTRVVEYSADKHNGFVAVVKRAGGYAKPEITYHGVKRY